MKGKSILILLVFLGILLLSACATVAVPTPEAKEVEQRAAGEEKIGVEGEISLDRNVYIVFDGSGSMAESDCSGEKNSLARVFPLIQGLGSSRLTLAELWSEYP